MKKRKKLRETIANLTAKDIETNKYLLDKIEKLGEKSGDIEKLIQENRELDKENFDKVKINQQKLFKLLNDKFEKIISRREFNDELKNVISKLDNILKNQKNNLVNNCLNLKHINIEDFKGYFEEQNVLSFNILLLDYEEINYVKFNKETFVNSIASSKWNIIIDLNSKRENYGVDNEICQAYEKNLKMNFLKKKFEESESITVSDKHCIMKGSLLCYFIVDNLKDHYTSDSFPDDFQMFLEKIEY